MVVADATPDTPSLLAVTVSSSQSIRARKTIALAALLTLGGLIVATELRGPAGTVQRQVVAMWVLTVPLAITMLGLVRNRYWSRWVALAVGIAVLPWATALTFTPSYGLPVTRQAVALVASLFLIWSTSGAVMFEGYEGRVKNMDWGGRRMSLVRWTIICNIASALALYLFVTAYDHSIGWQLAVMASLLLGLVVGVLLLARQRTIGLLLVGLCCICFVPVGAHFALTESTYAGEAILFAAIFAPGILTGWASLLSFSKPIWSALRAG